MNDTTKVSDIKVEDVAGYIRLDELTEDDERTLETLIDVAVSFVRNYIGGDEGRVDYYPDLVIVVLILCQDMWDNRTMYVEKNNLNFAVKSILDMHSVNLL